MSYTDEYVDDIIRELQDVCKALEASKSGERLAELAQMGRNLDSTAMSIVLMARSKEDA